MDTKKRRLRFFKAAVFQMGVSIGLLYDDFFSFAVVRPVSYTHLDVYKRQASMLAGMGMNPIAACLVCMLANAFPTAFGSVGIPTVTLANVTGLDALPLAFTTVVQMIPFMILVPFLMVIVGGGGVKALKGVVGITLVSGASFVLPQLIVAKFTGPELADVYKRQAWSGIWRSAEPYPPGWGRTRRCWRSCWGRSSPGCPGRWRRPAAAGCF